MSSFHESSLSPLSRKKKKIIQLMENPNHYYSFYLKKKNSLRNVLSLQLKFVNLATICQKIKINLL